MKQTNLKEKEGNDANSIIFLVYDVKYCSAFMTNLALSVQHIHNLQKMQER